MVGDEGVVMVEAGPLIWVHTPVPLVAALNSLNVLDLLMANKYQYIFIIALILLSISIIVAEIFVSFSNSRYFGYYPIIVEVFSLPLYMYFIRRSTNHKQSN